MIKRILIKKNVEIEKVNYKVFYAHTHTLARTAHSVNI